MTIFFTSDTHFNHKNIIKYCNRPYETVEEMNDALIHNWNSVVNDGDVVYHLGDFGFGKYESLKLIYNQLNGYKVLVKGNHDELDVLNIEWNDFCETRLSLKISRHKELNMDVYFPSTTQPNFILDHFPIESWQGKEKGAIHLHGHTHNTLKNIIPNRMDVGVDACNYFPISLEQVRKKLQERDFPVDVSVVRGV